MEITGKRALVTGAGGSIGVAICQRLAADGVEIIALDIAKGPLEQLKDKFGAQTICADLENLETLASQVESVGPVDILVNNAGILNNQKLMAQNLQEWHRTQRINVGSALVLMQTLLPGMVDRGWGRIINMSSYAAKCGGLTAGTAYTTSKAALTGLTFSIAREFAGKGITANAIAPAYVMSPMVSEQLTDEQRADLLKAIPVGRFCAPEEVAHAVAFLASPLAGFITGEVIDINGGLQFD
ncbi:SDR family NAD(P)-dependent oxidoreductase [Falsihalocynthiibacter arcticus]|uniref:3-oxoacyl-ACP reductase n=1 Tax=Falsihalocynthiibacter arcticus TaxID=1579316 RepID=A0A126V0K8_9RHOB|nr:SDR family NAD(P)-dependent oxidoreductase [Falsihalocynthiibacter arcticus]AML51843.1 3-oxoacyl-ACP reductase [Falsihalocynthiibacter arcticus]